MDLSDSIGLCLLLDWKVNNNTWQICWSKSAI